MYKIWFYNNIILYKRSVLNFKAKAFQVLFADYYNVPRSHFLLVRWTVQCELIVLLFMYRLTDIVIVIKKKKKKSTNENKLLFTLTRVKMSEQNCFLYNFCKKRKKMNYPFMLLDYYWMQFSFIFLFSPNCVGN